MQEINKNLAPFVAFKQFVNYDPETKTPLDYRTRRPANAQDPSVQTDFATASAASPHVGFVFTDHDPFFFLDIDKCLQPDNTWSPLALSLTQQFAGCAIEVSKSGRGLHIFGRGIPPEHACKNVALGLELYHKDRYVALTGNCAPSGSCDFDASHLLPDLVSTYFPPRSNASGVIGWTDEASELSCPIKTDDALVKAATDASPAFHTTATFEELWTANAEALARSYPDAQRGHDGSSADAALAQHLAFWTGGNCERMRRLMLKSALVRDKWTERPDYLEATIQSAVSRQASWYGQTKALKLMTVADPADRERLSRKSVGWFEQRADIPAEQLAQALRPLEALPDREPAPAFIPSPGGAQILSIDMQREHFKGYVRVNRSNEVLKPNGTWLTSAAFKASLGGFTFIVDAEGKTTRNAWEAFTETQLGKFPEADDTCFDPQLPFGSFRKDAGVVKVNTFQPCGIVRKDGDPGPFLSYLDKVYPDGDDKLILLSYMAACVQHAGTKFQWCPFLQGPQGSGKGAIRRVLEHAIGVRYCKDLKKKELESPYNGYLYETLFVYLSDLSVKHGDVDTIEELKSMIVETRQSVRRMYRPAEDVEVLANFMIDSNHKNALGHAVTDNERRFAPLFMRPQSAADLRDLGLRDGDFFPKFYAWLRADGFGILAKYLDEFDIPDKYNPAGSCVVAPKTVHSAEAIDSALGPVEQHILDAVEEGAPGFCGGWISSGAVKELIGKVSRKWNVTSRHFPDLLRPLGYHRHPALRDGRTNNPTGTDGRKVVLYVKLDHPSILEGLNPAAVAASYDAAQSPLASQ